MKFLTLTLFGIVLLVAIAEAIVCPRDYCKRVTCPTNLEETCQEHIVPNSSFCGCCPTCVTYIEPNGFCLNLQIKVLITSPAAVNRRRCAPGYVCTNNRCQKEN
uniref:Secreted peptide n=1 Tax=Pristhesancus plagipennis TaxID=1955184 RepID=A0A2K8JS28_PRIPG|nr:secreted peptide [Pristhesancus plagipennis]